MPPLISSPSLDALRGRVNRLLRGEQRPDDLTHLFLFARDHNDGRQTVKEIGNFVAHHGERLQGLITKQCQDFFTVLNFNFRHWGKDIDGRKLPKNVHRIMLANSRLLDQSTIKHIANTSRADAAKKIPQIMQRLVKNSDGTFSVPPDMPKLFLDIMNAYCGAFNSEPAFTDEQLYTEFLDTLRSNSLLSKADSKKLFSVRKFITLYALAAMHQSVILFEEGNRATLRLNISKGDKKQQEADGQERYLAIDVVYEIDPVDNNEYRIATPIFTTSVLAEDGCSATLLGRARPWDFAIELDRGRLSPVF